MIYGQNENDLNNLRKEKTNRKLSIIKSDCIKYLNSILDNL